jgi:nucleotide-binding universal stress UspA family protein
MNANPTEVEIKKVLWPTDFSSSAKKALPYISSLTMKYGAEIHVLYVIDDVAHHRGWYGEFDKDHINKLAERTNESAKNHLNQICDKYLEGCPLYIKHLAVGDPAQEILKLIDKEEIDMVVMASRGERGHFRYGSVFEKVLKNSSVPIATIPVNP